MRALPVICLILLLSLSFAVGIVQDYPSKMHLTPNETRTYGVRVYNTLDNDIGVVISHIDGTGFATLMGPKEHYSVGPHGRLELFFNISAPAKDGVYFDRFSVTETKADDPNAMIDTAVSPEFTIGLIVAEEAPKPEPEPVITPAKNLTNSTNETAPPTKTNPTRPEGLSLSALIGGLLGAILLIAIIFLLVKKRREAEQKKAPQAKPEKKGEAKEV